MIRRPFALLLAVCAATLLFLPSAAAAHAVLVTSTPSWNAVVRATPRQVTLTYDEDVVPTYARVTVVVGTASRDVAGPPRVSGNVVVVDLGPGGLPVREDPGTVVLEPPQVLGGVRDPPVEQPFRRERGEPARTGAGRAEQALRDQALDQAVGLDPVHGGEARELARRLGPGPARLQVEAGGPFGDPVVGEQVP